MTETFKIFFERRERNPLRKEELRDVGRISNIEYIEQEKSNLDSEDQAKIDRMVELKVPEELITKFRNAKITEKEKSLKRDFLRTKLNERQLWFKLFGIKVYVDEYVENPSEFEKSRLNNLTMRRIIGVLVNEFRDVLPVRKFNIVVTDNTKNPIFHELSKKMDATIPGVYRDRIIYLNKYNIDDPELLIHEYSHFIADRIPNEIYPMLKREYDKMLEEFFGKKTKRQNLAGKRNKSLRAEVAKKMNLPSEYSATNPDEWFAELMQNWKNFPNNKKTYRFKSILKKIIGRL